MFKRIVIIAAALLLIPATVAFTKDDDVENVDLAANEILVVECDYKLELQFSSDRRYRLQCLPKPVVTKTPKPTKTLKPTKTPKPTKTIVVDNTPTSTVINETSTAVVNTPTSTTIANTPTNTTVA